MGLTTQPAVQAEAWALADEHMQYGNAMLIGYRRAAQELTAPVGQHVDRARYALRAITDTVRVTRVMG